MKHMCSPELEARIVALETSIAAFKDLMEERDERYAQRATSQDTAVAAALATSKEAVTKAETATEKRLEALNELRQVVVDQSKDFARTAEVKLVISAIEIRVAAIAEAMNTSVARGGGMKEVFGYVVGVGGMLVAALTVYFHR